MSPSWRYGWLLVGVVGLMVLVNWPDTRRDPVVEPEGSSPALERLADRQGRIEAQQKPWLDALWVPNPLATSEILAAGLDPDIVLDDLQNRPLHLLFIGQGCRRDQRPTASNTLTVLDLLLAAGADINAMDKHHNTPLMLAVTHCDAILMARLIAAGADPDQVNGRGLTAFEMTLASPGDAAYALLDAGFRLAPGKLQQYREIYADEPLVMKLLDVAGVEP